jgi:biopolymer transport protein ExbD
MAMNVGAPKRGDMDVMIDINTTPLIDVMLVLLVMLIITIPFQLHSVNLKLPTGNPPPPLVQPEVIKIDIDEGSRIFWNGDPVLNRDDLVTRIKAVAATQPQPEIHLRPNKESVYGTAAEVMAEAQKNGLTKIGIIGSEQFVDE